MSQSNETVYAIIILIGLGIAVNIFGKMAFYAPFFLMVLIATAMPSFLLFEHGELIPALIFAIVPAWLIYWFFKK